MKMGHIIKADLTRFIHSSGSRTVNTQILQTVPFTSANTLDKIRLPETAVIPVAKVIKCSITFFPLIHSNFILTREYVDVDT